MNIHGPRGNSEFTDRADRYWPITISKSIFQKSFSESPALIIIGSHPEASLAAWH
jgi:hypothetical protein